MRWRCSSSMAWSPRSLDPPSLSSTPPPPGRPSSGACALAFCLPPLPSASWEGRRGVEGPSLGPDNDKGAPGGRREPPRCQAGRERRNAPEDGVGGNVLRRIGLARQPFEHVRILLIEELRRAGGVAGPRVGAGRDALTPATRGSRRQTRPKGAAERLAHHAEHTALTWERCARPAASRESTLRSAHPPCASWEQERGRPINYRWSR